MPHAKLADIIETAFENRAAIGPATRGEVRSAVEEALGLLDCGRAWVAEKRAGVEVPLPRLCVAAQCTPASPPIR